MAPNPLERYIDAATAISAPPTTTAKGIANGAIIGNTTERAIKPISTMANPTSAVQNSTALSLSVLSAFPP